MNSFMKQKGLLLVCIFTLLVTTTNAQMNSVVVNSNANVLAQMLAGAGVTVSNAGFFGKCDSTVSAGQFYATPNSVFGLDSGIVLSSGNVLTGPLAVGVNIGAGQSPGTCGQAQFASSVTNGNSDPDLAALGNNITINDACILEFDFVPLGDTVKFDYVFGSEEYDIFNCSINDIFGFL
ncbi:MAG: choice-of-anchor L domain-containing protein [Bacteroidota bacterium]|nr:MAG: choice-of-anchor L domain-containing protein [Bacteroidota bacterium]